MESDRNEKISESQQLVNKPVYTVDGKHVGIVRTVQPENEDVEYRCTLSCLLWLSPRRH